MVDEVVEEDDYESSELEIIIAKSKERQMSKNMTESMLFKVLKLLAEYEKCSINEVSLDLLVSCVADIKGNGDEVNISTVKDWLKEN